MKQIYKLLNYIEKNKKFNRKREKGIVLVFSLIILFVIGDGAHAILTEPMYLEMKAWDARQTTWENEPLQAFIETKEETGDWVEEIEAGNNVGHSSASIESKIREVFGEEGENALKIAKCESRFNPETVGDGHLTFQHNGQTYGESIGLFQIRTGGNEGGKVWTRSDNVEEFKKEMMNPIANIKKAKDAFDNSGSYRPWYNCAKLNGLL